MTNTKTKILIATHTPQSTCSIDFTASLLQTERYFVSKNIEIDVNFITSNVTRSCAHNMSISKLLSNEEYTHILFVNTNVRFAPQYIESLLDNDKEVIGGVTTVNTIRWENVFKDTIFNKIVELRQILTQEEKPSEDKLNQAVLLLINFIRANSSIYDMEFSDDLSIKDALLNVSYVGSNFLLIKRDAIIKMIDYYSYTKYEDKQHTSVDDNKHLYSLFQAKVEGGEYQSADKVFCKRWQTMGGKIYIDVRLTFSVLDNYRFNGNLLSALGQNIKSPNEDVSGEDVSGETVINDSITKEPTIEEVNTDETPMVEDIAKQEIQPGVD